MARASLSPSQIRNGRSEFHWKYTSLVSCEVPQYAGAYASTSQFIRACRFESALPGDNLRNLSQAETVSVKVYCFDEDDLCRCFFGLIKRNATRHQILTKLQYSKCRHCNNRPANLTVKLGRLLVHLRSFSRQVRGELCKAISPNPSAWTRRRKRAP